MGWISGWAFSFASPSGPSSSHTPRSRSCARHRPNDASASFTPEQTRARMKYTNIRPSATSSAGKFNIVRGGSEASMLVEEARELVQVREVEALPGVRAVFEAGHVG